MSKRVSPCERLRAQIDEVFAGAGDLAGRLSRSLGWEPSCCCRPRSTREVAAFLGRERYERAASCQNPRPGMRNGHCPTTVKTTAGPVVVQRPKLRGTTERWRPTCSVATGMPSIRATAPILKTGLSGIWMPYLRSVRSLATAFETPTQALFH